MNTQTLLKSIRFAAEKHRDQRRKGVSASPYINHPIEVAETLARSGVTDPVTLQAAILHDTIEDTQTTPEEIEREFGPEVRKMVEEVTDDKSLPKAERKRLQIQHAPHLSEGARQIKIADKLCNLRDVTHAPPDDWTMERRQEYLAWTEKVVEGCRGLNCNLDDLYDQMLAEGRKTLFVPD